MTVLAIAMRGAGIVLAEERLRELALAILRAPQQWSPYEEAMHNSPATDIRRLEQAAMAAIKEFPRNWDGAKDALYKAVRNDAALLWALFEPYRLQAVQRVLTEATAELRQSELEVLRKVGTADPSPPDNRDLSVRRPADPKPAMSAIASVAQQSLLDTFRANGRAIGDLTPREANRWAQSRERDARFVRLLTQNLPPDEPIRKFRKPDDAAALYEQAGKEIADEG